MPDRRATLATLAAALALTLLTPGGRAGAQPTITFAANACTGIGSTVYATPFEIDGFRLAATGVLTAAAFRTFCTGSPQYPGTTALLDNGAVVMGGSGGTTTLTRISGAPFSVTSVGLAPFFVGSSAQNVTFTGVLAGGGTVTQTFALPPSSGPPTVTTFTFDPAFRNLASLQFGPQELPFYQYTNVALGPSVVPEPTTSALLSIGLLVLSGAVWWTGPRPARPPRPRARGQRGGVGRRRSARA